MKIIEPWMITRVINKGLQRKKPKINRPLYLQLLREAEKYPLIVRIANELSRAGITPQRFIAELHKEDYSISSRVMEELEVIGRGRCKYSPDRVPTVLPVVVERRDTDELRMQKGRPTRETAKRLVAKWVKPLLAAGWKTGDVIRAVEDVLAINQDVVYIEAEEELEEAPKVSVRTKTKYYVFDGLDFQVFDSPKKAKDAIAVLKSLVLDNVRRAEPMPDINARICAECKTPLNGHVMTLRGPKVGRKRPVLEHLHHNCYWLKRVEACRIPVGMTMLCPADGKTYTWKSVEKGGWVHDSPGSQKAETVSASSTSGVSGAGSPHPATPVPTPPPTGESVPQVR